MCFCEKSTRKTWKLAYMFALFVSLALPGSLNVDKSTIFFSWICSSVRTTCTFFRCWKQMKCVCDLFECCFSLEINFKLRAHRVWNGQTCTREQPPAFRNHNWWTCARSYDWSSNISYSIKWILLLFVKCYHVCDRGSISVVSPFQIIIWVSVSGV